MKKCYEKLWRDIQNITTLNDITMVKNTIKYRTDAGICYFIAELDFHVGDNNLNTISFDLPDITDNFMVCENTIFAEKTLEDDISDTVVKLRLQPNGSQNSKLILTAYPFSAKAKYELNIQLFMCLTDKKFIAPNK
jgi:hypothetical protein